MARGLKLGAINLFQLSTSLLCRLYNNQVEAGLLISSSCFLILLINHPFNKAEKWLIAVNESNFSFLSMTRKEQYLHSASTCEIRISQMSWQRCLCLQYFLSVGECVKCAQWEFLNCQSKAVECWLWAVFQLCHRLVCFRVCKMRLSRSPEQRCFLL